MEFFRNTQIDFMKYRFHWLTVSVALVLTGVVTVFVHGKLNIGIDFAGGTQVTLRFLETPQLDVIREVLAEAGVQEAQIQRFGAEADNEVMIRAPLEEGSEEGSGEEIRAALGRRFNVGPGTAFDLNLRGVDALSSLLLESDPMGLRANDDELASEEYGRVAAAILELRRLEGIFTDWGRIGSLPEVGPEVLAALQREAFLGGFSLLGEESVGPQIGSELRAKGIWAVALSLIGMLAYIWVRFELRFGVGALVALAHDVLITLGLFALLDYEFNLSTIAAFLTLIGYSVNDTVVVFDRVRENLRRNVRMPFIDQLNLSLNQTLSRTVLTSGTTLLVVCPLYFLGGDVLRGFAFVLMIGVVVGTYSSIFIASPFALWWQQLAARTGKENAGKASGGDSRAQRRASSGRQ